MKQILPTDKKIIPTNIHGMIDYFFGFLLIATPTIGRFANDKIATVFFILMGVLVMLNSIFTKYEQGSFEKFTMKQHLKFDMGIAGAIIVAPFLLGFWDDIIVPNIIIGLMIFATAWMTKEEVEVKIEEEKPMRIRVTRPRTKEELYRMYGNSVARSRK